MLCFNEIRALAYIPQCLQSDIPSVYSLSLSLTLPYVVSIPTTPFPIHIHPFQIQIQIQIEKQSAYGLQFLVGFVINLNEIIRKQAQTTSAVKRELVAEN